jgi:hypothetical protein
VRINADPVEQTLGTGFGDASTFETTTVDFERGDMIALFELFYDDAQGLKRRGIDVRRGAPARPSAFPADEPKGCHTAELAGHRRSNRISRQ